MNSPTSEEGGRGASSLLPLRVRADLRGEDEGGGASSEEGGTAEEDLLFGVDRVDLAGDDIFGIRTFF